MTVSGWWNERRYGLFVHASIATVPSFSPIGESSDWYWPHLGSDALVGIAPHPSPLAEVLAYHLDRWSHVGHYDEFLPFLSFHRFDADEQVELALDAGMNSIVHVAKAHDGFCWWDAPGARRSSIHHGPHRDVLAEVAAACRRNGVQFGTSTSLLDWSDRRSGQPVYGQHVLHPQVLDLVERYGTQILCADGDPGRVRERWNIDELIERAVDLADAQGIELVIDDRWGHPKPTVRTLTGEPPTDIDLRPWELRRPLAASRGHNRAEQAEHLLSSGALFDLLTEVVAKGGSLRVDIGPTVDGSISELVKRPLRDVGDWVRAHPDVIHGGRPFDQWGDAQVRYLQVGDDVVAIDLAAGAEIVLAGLTPDRYEVATIEAEDGGSLHWEQHRGGVSVSRIDRSPAGLAGAYRIRLRPVAEAIRLFDEREAAPKPLQRLLDAARPGDIVQLAEGRYQGPIVVPSGVVVRGVGWDRTVIVGGPDATRDPARAVAVLGAGSRIEHIHLADPPALVTISSAAVLRGAGAALVGCRCDGLVLVEGNDALVQSVIGIGVAGGADRTTVERCALRGDRQAFGITLTGGVGHLVHRNEIVDQLGSVRLVSASAAIVSENRLEGRWWGVHLLHCDHVEVVDNNIQHAMRAVDVDGGNGSIVTGNWIADGDSGALIQFGATDTNVIDNHVERCRVGVVVWDAPTTLIGPNTFVDLHEEAPVVRGPDADVDAD